MVVHLAFVGRATPLKRLDLRARGKTGRLEKSRTHLTVVVREAPPQEGHYTAEGRYVDGPPPKGRRVPMARHASAGEPGLPPPPPPVPAWERHKQKRGGVRRMERLTKRLGARPPGLWAEETVLSTPGPRPPHFGEPQPKRKVTE